MTEQFKKIREENKQQMEQLSNKVTNQLQENQKRNENNLRELALKVTETCNRVPNLIEQQVSEMLAPVLGNKHVQTSHKITSSSLATTGHDSQESSSLDNE